MKLQTLSFLVILLLTAACSAQKDTWTSKAFHNTTAHYNAYWYAREEITKIEETIRKAHVDDYNRILMLFPSFDSAMAKSYDKEIQECIKMASLAIQRHPNSKWVDDSYILVGKARHYSMDWGNAIQSFKYTNKISKNDDARHRAIIELIRTYVEHNELSNARSAIDYLLKQKLNKENQKQFLLEKAYFHQINKDYNNMVGSLTAATPLLKKSDRRGRIFFIIGQVYQKLGFEAEAYSYYRKCISTNPEYEVDFYARLYMAQVTVISRNRDIQAARKSFAKLLKDSKNKDFKDKIYYEMGSFELRQKNINDAVQYYNQSVREGKNTRIDGEAYLRLGEIYYDTLRNYEMSQAYYDSAIATLPTDYEGYAEIKTRQEILNEFVKHLKTIQWQDSLLQLAKTDSSVIIAFLETKITEQRKAEKAAAKKKKRDRIQIQSNDNNTLFDNGEATPIASQEEGKGWYFYAPSAVASGQTEFARKWGNIQLSDNWRRSSRQSAASSQRSEPDENATASTQQAETTEQPVEDAARAEFQKLAAEIPYTDEKKKEALAKIEEAYFAIGGIYYLKLKENNNAADAYTTLLERFPQSEFAPEALYTLYLIYNDVDTVRADEYARTLKTLYPQSTFAKILINPAYLQESSLTAEKQKAIYKTAYEVFANNDYRGADSVLQQAFALGETSFEPNLRLLKVMITGKTEDVSQYQYQLEQFIQKYPETELSKFAQSLLNTSRKFIESQTLKRGIQYIRSLDEPHYFVLLYKKQEKIDELVTTALTYFNEGHFTDYTLNVSTLAFSDEYSLAFVSEIPNVSTAIEYFRTFSQNSANINEFKNLKFDKFVITKDNFDIFYRTKGLDEYLQFFEKNYPDKNQ